MDSAALHHPLHHSRRRRTGGASRVSRSAGARIEVRMPVALAGAVATSIASSSRWPERVAASRRRGRLTMDLILWRHCDAEAGVPDEARRAHGARRCAGGAHGAMARAQLPDTCRILVSPAVRAQQTAQALERKFADVARNRNRRDRWRRCSPRPLARRRASRCSSSGISRRSGASHRSCWRARRPTAQCARGRSGGSPIVRASRHGGRC